jgi:hypothetical protein
MVELARNPEPVTVSVNPPDPAAAEEGLSDWTTGAGFCGFGAGVELEPPHDIKTRQRRQTKSTLSGATDFIRRTLA